MKFSHLFLFFLFGISTHVCAQACFDVEITTTPLIILPECNDTSGSVLFSNTRGGNPPYNFEFNGSTNRFGSFNNLSIGIYDLIITDTRGCADTFNIDITYRDIKEIIKPNNAFTPNGDGFNDTWYIQGIESFAGSEVSVFNRWGQKVHNNSNYSNEAGWDGKQANLDVTSGTYFYVIYIKNNCLDEYLNGTVTIIR
jgi:gliding motility-associated-like protein